MLVSHIGISLNFGYLNELVDAELILTDVFKIFVIS